MQDRYQVPIEVGAQIQDLVNGDVYTVTDIDALDSYVETTNEQGEEGPCIYNTHVFYMVIRD